MPGPKMGPRPVDFNETIIKQSPTYVKWQKMAPGQTLRYACREFVKGHGDDEERLMRRIMIARRNNIKDHETLKQARSATGSAKEDHEEQDTSSSSEAAPSVTRTASPPPEDNSEQFPLSAQQQALHPNNNDLPLLSDEQIRQEMDVPAVEATRSYRAWQVLPHGADFVYNQRYVKGQEGHDFLLRKNIWRRMRYRRENKRLVARWKQQPNAVALSTPSDLVEPTRKKLKVDRDNHPSEKEHVKASPHPSAQADKPASPPHDLFPPSTTLNANENKNEQIIKEGALQAAAAAAALEKKEMMDFDAVEAAVAAAESFCQQVVVNDPILAATQALDDLPLDGHAHHHDNSSTLDVHDPLQTAALAAQLAAVSDDKLDMIF